MTSSTTQYSHHVVATFPNGSSFSAAVPSWALILIGIVVGSILTIVGIPTVILVLKRGGYYLHFTRPNEDARLRRPSLTSTPLPASPVAVCLPSILIKPPEETV